MFAVANADDAARCSLASVITLELRIPVKAEDGGPETFRSVHQSSLLRSLEVPVVRQPPLTSLQFVLCEQLVPFHVVVNDGLNTQIEPLQLPEPSVPLRRL